MQRVQLHAGKNRGKWRARVVMEGLLGRSLLPSELVHHKDEDPGNDLPNNIEVESYKGHFWKHPKKVEALKLGTIVSRQTKHPGPRIKPPTPNQSWCFKCKQFKHVSEFSFLACRWNSCDFECRECKGKRNKRRY